MFAVEVQHWRLPEAKELGRPLEQKAPDSSSLVGSHRSWLWTPSPNVLDENSVVQRERLACPFEVDWRSWRLEGVQVRLEDPASPAHERDGERRLQLDVLALFSAPQRHSGQEEGEESRALQGAKTRKVWVCGRRK